MNRRKVRILSLELFECKNQFFYDLLVIFSLPRGERFLWQSLVFNLNLIVIFVIEMFLMKFLKPLKLSVLTLQSKILFFLTNINLKIRTFKHYKISLSIHIETLKLNPHQINNQIKIMHWQIMNNLSVYNFPCKIKKHRMKFLPEIFHLVPFSWHLIHLICFSLWQLRLMKFDYMV